MARGHEGVLPRDLSPRDNGHSRPERPRMTDLYAEALATFDELLDEARRVGDPEPTAMTVATVDADGRPSARTVLLKAHDARGFVFYTNFDSQKGRELAANPHAALLFLWKNLRLPEHVQVRIEGT